MRPSLAPNPIEPIFGGHALSTSHAARCTVRHGVGSHAEKPTTEWGDADREEVRAPVARRVGRELHVPALVRHAGDDEAEARQRSLVRGEAGLAYFSLDVRHDHHADGGPEVGLRAVHRERASGGNLLRPGRCEMSAGL